MSFEYLLGLYSISSPFSAFGIAQASLALLSLIEKIPFLIGRVRPVHSLFEKKSILKNLIQMAQIDFGVLFPFFIGHIL